MRVCCGLHLIAECDTEVTTANSLGSRVLTLPVDSVRNLIHVHFFLYRMQMGQR